MTSKTKLHTTSTLNRFAITTPGLTLLLAGALGTPVSAFVTDFHVVQTNATSEEGDPLILNDLMLSFNGDYFGSQLLVELDAGSIYQHPFESAPFRPPTSPRIILNPAYTDTADTYFAHGPLYPRTHEVPFVAGGPVDIDRAYPDTLNTPTELGVAWSRPGFEPIVDEQDFWVFRLALTPDAAGSFRFWTSTDDGTAAVAQSQEFDTGAADTANFAIVAGQVVETAPTPAQATAPTTGSTTATPSPEPAEPEPTVFQPTDWLLNSWGTQSDVDWLSAYRVPGDGAFSWPVTDLRRTYPYGLHHFEMGKAPTREIPSAGFRGSGFGNIRFVDGHAAQSVGLSDASRVVATPEPALMGVVGLGAMLLGRRRMS